MTINATKDGEVAVPAALARQAGIEPGEEIDIELTGDGLLVRRKAAADAEDAEDVAAAETALRELDEGAESVPWEKIKRRHGL